MIRQIQDKPLLYVLLGFFCLTALVASNAQAQEKKESFYSQAIRGVVRLDHYMLVQNNIQYSAIRTTLPDGTGFFVLTSDSLFIVTAAHVVRKDHDLHALVPLTGGEQTEIWELRLPRSEWVFHPMQATETTHAVDVAVMKIPANKADIEQLYPEEIWGSSQSICFLRNGS